MRGTDRRTEQRFSYISPETPPVPSAAQPAAREAADFLKAMQDSCGLIQCCSCGLLQLWTNPDPQLRRFVGGLAGRSGLLALLRSMLSRSPPWRTVAPKRDELAACLAFLAGGDTLVVTSPDCLAETPAELLTIASDLSKRESRGDEDHRQGETEHRLSGAGFPRSASRSAAEGRRRFGLHNNAPRWPNIALSAQTCPGLVNYPAGKQSRPRRRLLNLATRYADHPGGMRLVRPATDMWLRSPRKMRMQSLIIRMLAMPSLEY